MTAEHIHQLRNRCRGALLGLACGDALGTTLEFHPPDTFNPLGLEAALWAFHRSSSFDREALLAAKSGQRCRHDVRYLRTVGRRDVWNVGDSATMAGTSCDAKAYRTNGGSAVGALLAPRVCCSLARLKSLEAASGAAIATVSCCLSEDRDVPGRTHAASSVTDAKSSSLALDYPSTGISARISQNLLSHGPVLLVRKTKTTMATE
jgi:hypothetical protein